MKPELELLKSKWLTDFPSGSSINYHAGKLYLVGDDANHIWILDKEYEMVGTIRIFDHADKRIPKPEKADFETSTIIQQEGIDHLIVFGSASKKERTKVLLIPLQVLVNEYHFELLNYGKFVERMEEAGIEEINIEGSTLIGNHFMLSNRANNTHPTNNLIVTESDFWKRQQEVSLSVSQLILPVDTKETIGVSELWYVETRDLLLVTLSSEITSNSYDDGTIGASYFGWLNGISHKIYDPVMPLDGMINLSEVSKEFVGEKIEGVCVESVSNNEYTLHLISDDDQGHSKLFKVKMMLMF